MHNKRITGEKRLFLKRWLRNPLRLGAVAPSSQRLVSRVAQHVRLNPDEYVIELGGGTGRLTKAILNHGIPADKLIVLELDGELCQYLRKTFPDVTVLEADACEMASLLSDKIGKVTTVVSGMPISTMPRDVQRRIVIAVFQMLRAGGEFIQFSYHPVSPISAKKLGLEKKLLGLTVRNIPPATIWKYWRKEENPKAVA